MSPDLPTPALGALAIVEDELGRPWTDLRNVNLVLAFLAYPLHWALADLAQRRAADLNRLVDLLGNRPASALSIPLGGLAARRLGVALRLPRGGGGGWAFAALPHSAGALPHFSLLALSRRDALPQRSDPLATR